MRLLPSAALLCCGWAVLGGCGDAGVAERTGRADGAAPVAARVVSVTDGDTVRVEVDGRVDRLRLLGIDAPEASTTRTGSVQCGAGEATRALRALVARDPVVRLVADPDREPRDRFGRRLAYVEPASGGRTLQEELLAAGWARVYAYRGEPFARQAAFEAAATEARERGAGVWRTCGGRFDLPR